MSASRIGEPVEILYSCKTCELYGGPLEVGPRAELRPCLSCRKPVCVMVNALRSLDPVCCHHCQAEVGPLTVAGRAVSDSLCRDGYDCPACKKPTLNVTFHATVSYDYGLRQKTERIHCRALSTSQTETIAVAPPRTLVRIPPVYRSQLQSWFEVEVTTCWEFAEEPPLGQIVENLGESGVQALEHLEVRLDSVPMLRFDVNGLRRRLEKNFESGWPPWQALVERHLPPRVKGNVLSLDLLYQQALSHGKQTVLSELLSALFQYRKRSHLSGVWDRDIRTWRPLDQVRISFDSQDTPSSPHCHFSPPWKLELRGPDGQMLWEVSQEA